MNSLSWFLYLADVVQNFGTLLFSLGIILTPVAGMCIIIGYLVPWNHKNSLANAEESIRSRASFAWIAPRATAVAVVLLSVSMLIPAKRTMYMIAASEMGEMVVQSDEAKEIFNELKLTVIDQLRTIRVPPKSSTESN